jgi:hypothetical protein
MIVVRFGECRKRRHASCLCLDTHMRRKVYKERGICFRNHCGAEPPRDIEPPGLVTAISGRDRAATSDAAAHRVEAPASAARGRFRGIHGGRTAPSLPVETGAASRSGCLAGSLPPVLVRSRRRAGTPPRPHGSNANIDEKEDTKKKTRRKPANVTREKRNENQIDQPLRGRPG